MPYHDSIDEDLARATQIVAEGKSAPEDRPDWMTDHQWDQLASGAICGKDTYAAYKLLESFVAEIEKLREGLCRAGAVLDDAAEIAGRNDVPQLSQSYEQAAEECWTLAGGDAVRRRKTRS